MPISLIVAAAENNEIGHDNKLLWHIPEDFKWFIQNTKNKPVIMGRKTHESIGKALPNRHNIVVTKQQNYTALSPEVQTENSLSNLLENLDNQLEYMILGGEKIYQQTLPYANKIYLTRVHKSYPEADTFFPELDLNNWQETFAEHHPSEGPKNPKSPAFTFMILERKKD